MERDVSAADWSGDAPRFLADTMLGRLATWLRILGYDTEYFRGADADLIARAQRDGRFLLTRDTGILRRRGVPPHLLIRDDRVMAQLRQVMAACQMAPAPTAARRCPRCNVLLEPRIKAEIAGRVPEFVWSRHDTFQGCPSCGRIYWAGSHRQRMDETIHALLPGR